MSYGGIGIEQNVNVGGLYIPRTMIRTIVITGQLLLWLPQMYDCVNKYADGPGKILFPIHSVLAYSVKMSIYAVLLSNTNRIAQLFEYLQMVVAYRKLTILTD